MFTSCLRWWGSSRTKSVTATVLLVALVGCGHTNHRTSTTQAPSASSTTSALSVGAAAHRYLVIADVLNAKVAAGTARLQVDAKDLAKVKADYQAIADAYRVFDQALRQIGFPSVATSDEHELLRADATLQLYLQAAAYAHDLGELHTNEQGIAEAASEHKVRVDTLRRDLGLPASPG